MSWQEYVDDHLMTELPQGGTLTNAAIVGLDKGVWASSPGFPELSDQELEAVINDLERPSGTLAETGLYLGGVKYLVVMGDPGSVIRGKKGQDGVSIKKTGKALVIGMYGEGVQPGDANLAVENLADYLIGQGY